MVLEPILKRLMTKAAREGMLLQFTLSLAVWPCTMQNTSFRLQAVAASPCSSADALDANYAAGQGLTCRIHMPQ